MSGPYDNDHTTMTTLSLVLRSTDQYQISRDIFQDLLKILNLHNFNFKGSVFRCFLRILKCDKYLEEMFFIENFQLR